MATELAELLDSVRQDPWRAKVGFSDEVRGAMEVIHNESSALDEIEDELDRWLSKFQPCLFGRIAAKRAGICYCLLDEGLVRTSDEAVQEAIQEARLNWRRKGWGGEASGFIIVVRSPSLATGLPDDNIRRFAMRLVSLYLGHEVEPDQIYHDEIYLEAAHGNRRSAWRWKAGVNYFSAQGDRRWWQDHRFPAGMALSVNSVGHMVRSGKLDRAIHDLEGLMDIEEGDFRDPKIDSLEKALEMAMRTIDMASEGPSGRATLLKPRANDESATLSCPVALPARLADKDYCSYSGLYHTDYTVPSEYFRADVQVPAHLNVHELDFSYLFHRHLDNPDHVDMGEGQRIRELGSGVRSSENDQREYRRLKRLRGVETEVQVDIEKARDILGLT